jgi:hypothetical protein
LLRRTVLDATKWKNAVNVKEKHPRVPKFQDHKKDGPDLSVKTLGREWMWSPAGDLDAAQQKSGMDYS